MTSQVWDAVPHSVRYQERHEIEEALPRARALLDSIRAATADLRAAGEAIRKDPDLPQPLRRAAMNLLAREAQRVRDSIDRYLDPLFAEHLFVEQVIAALVTDADLTPDFREAAIGRAHTRGDPSSTELNDRAWRVVDPDGNGAGDRAHALKLARAAVKLDPGSAPPRDTLAWALFANGLHDEAAAESARALELASEAEKAAYQGYLERLRSMVEAARASEEKAGVGTEVER